MITRKKIALTYFYSENWIAGSYYVVNLIKALNHLAEAEKPQLFILNQDDQKLDLIREIGYPYISFIHPNARNSEGVAGIMQRIIKRIKGQDYFLKRKLRGVDHVFEGGDQYPFIKNQYYWVHDFQEFRLPEFFSKEDAEKRSALPRKVARLSDAVLIVSSYDALNDFNTFIPGAVCKVNVWRFTSSPPDFSTINFQEECERLKIDRPFFICSNQFWQHKNHKAILEAIRLLKEKNLLFQVVFTGQNFDHRNPEYFNSLQSFITANQLAPWVNFVGFIDRKVQLCVAKHAISYIQPSFFEGWSTTVEDAKYLNQYVLLSDIPVHKEQMNYNVSFFNPSNPADLAEKMEALVKGAFKKEEREYKQNIINYGKDVLKTFSTAG